MEKNCEGLPGCKKKKDNCPEYFNDCLKDAIKYIERFGFNGIE